MLEVASPGVFALRVPLAISDNPEVAAYLVEDAEGAPHVIDAGVDDATTRTVVADALAERGWTIGDVRSVTITHLHPDHVGIAGILRAGGATVAMHADDARTLGVARSISRTELARWGVPDSVAGELAGVREWSAAAVPIDRRLEDGDELDIPGRRFRVLHTPGHTAGHICIVADDDRLVFTGDHLLPDMFPGVGLGGIERGNPMAAYLRSLTALRDIDGYTALPGHGSPFTSVLQRATATAEHHLRRAAEVRAVLASDPGASTWTIASRLSWSAGWGALEGSRLVSALRQASWHQKIVGS